VYDLTVFEMYKNNSLNLLSYIQSSLSLSLSLSLTLQRRLSSISDDKNERIPSLYSFFWSGNPPTDDYYRALNYFTIVLIFAIALAGFKPFGHTLVQFIIV